jgi:hypothetical protein
MLKLAQLSNSLHFMEPEGSLPCSQGTATSRYSEQDESGPHTYTPFLHDPVYLLICAWEGVSKCE